MNRGGWFEHRHSLNSQGKGYSEMKNYTMNQPVYVAAFPPLKLIAVSFHKKEFVFHSHIQNHIHWTVTPLDFSV